jgi:predicted RNase H-like HicB family nuclease
MDLQFTAVFRQVPEGYIGFVEELPGANTQGATLEEARANLQEAVAMILRPTGSWPSRQPDKGRSSASH